MTNSVLANTGHHNEPMKKGEGLAMFRIGDLVAHPMHGAGVIDAVIQEKVGGNTQDYYVFKMPMGGLLLKIPVTNSVAIGVRPIITPEEAETMLRSWLPTLKRWRKSYRRPRLWHTPGFKDGFGPPTRTSRPRSGSGIFRVP